MPWGHAQETSIRKFGTYLRRLFLACALLWIAEWLSPSTVGVALLAVSLPSTVYYSLRTVSMLVSNHQAVISWYTIIYTLDRTLDFYRVVRSGVHSLIDSYRRFATKIRESPPMFGSHGTHHVCRQYASRCQGCGAEDTLAFYRTPVSMFRLAYVPVRVQRGDVEIYCEYCYDYHYEVPALSGEEEQKEVVV